MSLFNLGIFYLINFIIFAKNCLTLKLEHRDIDLIIIKEEQMMMLLNFILIEMKNNHSRIMKFRNGNYYNEHRNSSF